MAPPAEKKKKISVSDNRRLISSDAIGENEQQQPMGSLVTSFGKRQSVRVAQKMNKRILKKIWICTEVLMDILPFFDRPQLGFKLALLSPRFNSLVDKHFDGKSELTLKRTIKIQKGADEMPKLSVVPAKDPRFVMLTNNAKAVPFPFAERPLPNKIRFNHLQIFFINHFVFEFLRSNQKIFDGKGTKLDLKVFSRKGDVHAIWDVFVREIWPIFATNIRHLGFTNGPHLDNLRHRTSPTILSDLNIYSVDSGRLFPAAEVDENWPNTIVAGQALAKWLHIPTKDGQPKQLRFRSYNPALAKKWVNNFKEAFLRAKTSVRYIIHLIVYDGSFSMNPFDLKNERTNEMLTFDYYKGRSQNFLIKRCQIGETIQWEEQNLADNLNNVNFLLYGDKKCIGPFSPPAAGQSGGKDEK